MIGVEILATTEIAVDYAWDWKVYCITIAITSVVSAILTFLMYHQDLEDILTGLVAGLLIGAIIGVLPASINKPIAYETEYKVTIADEVSMNEFMAKYKIVNQEGKIYTVREINDE